MVVAWCAHLEHRVNLEQTVSRRHTQEGSSQIRAAVYQHNNHGGFICHGLRSYRQAHTLNRWCMLITHPEDLDCAGLGAGLLDADVLGVNAVRKAPQKHEAPQTPSHPLTH